MKKDSREDVVGYGAVVFIKLKDEYGTGKAGFVVAQQSTLAVEITPHSAPSHLKSGLFQIMPRFVDSSQSTNRTQDTAAHEKQLEKVAGQPVRFGDVVELRHLHTGEPLSICGLRGMPG